MAPYRHKRDRETLRRLADALSGWLRADLATLERAEPEMPVEDRAADTWEPLVAVADHAAGDWPERARAAALTLTAEADDSGQPSPRVRLLADCRTAFRTDTALPNVTLLERLRADPEAPWVDYGPNRLTAMKPGVLLREYDIRSATIRFSPPVSHAKGYQRIDFTEAWTRYCPGPDAPNRARSSHSAGAAIPAVPPSTSQVRGDEACATGTTQAVPPEKQYRP
ncbi:hypothetical protein GCM10009677_06780 [Sphaerisporangium rubeum]